MSKPVIELSIEALFSAGECYLIPMYQRNYAWEEGEIGQLIQDVIDAMPAAGAPAKAYYLGSLVVYPRPVRGAVQFETLDGQQRLTTLSLLMLYLHKRLPMPGATGRSPVAFENRPQAGMTLDALASAGLEDDLTGLATDERFNGALLNGYRLVRRLLAARASEAGVSIEAFADYLLKQVRIMRVEVPEGTDLNHYFEVMNNRGEQLEKHEVLKARMLSVLQDDTVAQAVLHQVWEACANMEGYVQAGFPAARRDRLFAEGHLKVNGYAQLASALQDAVQTPVDLTLAGILANAAGALPGRPEDREEGAERFGSVINFPNFLLHVLRLHAEEQGSAFVEDIALDDKRLLGAFDRHLLNAQSADRVKQFVVDLLRCKVLFDLFVIKRDHLGGTDHWSLKRFKSDDSGVRYINTFGAEHDDSNRRVLTLLSALHVSAPGQLYKYWLYAALRYLFRHADEPVEAGAYLDYLASIARGFVFDRALRDGARQASYHEIVHRQGNHCLSDAASVSEAVRAGRLKYGAIENNLVFNFLDYLLWEKYRFRDKDVDRFRFTFRSSVEHHYPRNPVSAAGLEKGLDDFGNLYLISHSRNSKLSNHLPEHKKQHYRAQEMDSVKQHLMHGVERWNETSIEAHEREMVSVLEESFAGTGPSARS